MKNISFVLILTILYQFSFCQYTTPGAGITWDLNDLVDNSEGTLSYDDGIYYLHDDLTISETDTLRILSDEIVRIEFEKLITVLGVFQALPPQELYITAIDTTQNFLGFKFDESGFSILKNCVIEFCGGIDLVYSNILIENCIIRKNDKSNSTGVVDLFHSNPQVINCEIYLNEGPAILSSANAECSPFVSGNYIYHNNTTNQNMPQINLGTSHPEIPIQILNNHIAGNYDMVGGIAVTTLVGGSIECIIQGNTIINNRYGITLYGNNITSVIDSNIIQDNNIQNIPLQGGSGINLWGDVSNSSMISQNTITGNLWGITNTGNALPNLGQVEPDTINIGKNYIYDNGNEGDIYDLYNNTPNNIFAENNHWGTYDLETIEMHIFHQPDDASLGFVDYMPIKDFITGISQPKNYEVSNLNMFPNPARKKIFLDFPGEINEKQLLIQVYNLSGQVIKTFDEYLKNRELNISEIKRGTYLLKISGDNFIEFRKLIKQ